MALTAAQRSAFINAARLRDDFRPRLTAAVQQMEKGSLYTITTEKNARRRTVSGVLTSRTDEVLTLMQGGRKANVVITDIVLITYPLEQDR